MKKFIVTMPVTGIAVIEVEAETEKEAIDIALFGDVDIGSDKLEEWSVHECIVEGSVFHGLLNKPYASEV